MNITVKEVKIRDGVIIELSEEEFKAIRYWFNNRNCSPGVLKYKECFNLGKELMIKICVDSEP